MHTRVINSQKKKSYVDALFKEALNDKICSYRLLSILHSTVHFIIQLAFKARTKRPLRHALDNGPNVIFIINIIIIIFTTGQWRIYNCRYFFENRSIIIAIL